MTGLEALTGRSFGPLPVDTAGGRVEDLVAAVGDDPARWDGHLPPYFANAALFAIAPAFLEDRQVRGFTRSLIHSEQSFTWHRSLAIGDPIEVTGTVESVRARGPLNLATFSLEARSDGDPWLSGSSVFLMSGSPAAISMEEPEPPADLRPPLAPMPSTDLPPAGSVLAPLAVGASRLDLVKYAAATGDWNPIHWDHQSAVAAGLPGTIVHGLLMTSWMARAAARFTTGPHPLTEMRARFRAPLRPGAAAELGGSVLAVDDEGADIDLVLGSGDERMVTARVRVTR